MFGRPAFAAPSPAEIQYSCKSATEQYPDIIFAAKYSVLESEMSEIVILPRIRRPQTNRSHVVGFIRIFRTRVPGCTGADSARTRTGGRLRVRAEARAAVPNMAEWHDKVAHGYRTRDSPLRNNLRRGACHLGYINQCNHVHAETKQ